LQRQSWFYLCPGYQAKPFQSPFLQALVGSHMQYTGCHIQQLSKMFETGF
jgi:hypothetical protein